MGGNDTALRRREVVALLVIVVIAAILRLPGLGYDSLWYDEIFAMDHVRSAESLSELLHDVQVYGCLAPLHEIVLSLWLRLGTSDFMARFPSAVAGLASIIAIFFLGRRIFNGQVGLLAATLLTFSRFHIRYSREARFYTIFVLFTLCSIIAFLRFVDRRTLANWATVVISHTICLYSAYYAAFVMAFEGLYATYLLLRDRLSSTREPVMTWRAYFASGGALALAGVFFLPWVIYTMARASTASGYPHTPLNGEWAWGYPHTPLNGEWVVSVLRHQSAGSLLSVVVFAAVFVAGVAYCVKERRHEGVLLVLISVLSPVAVLALQNKVDFFYHPRHSFFCLPSYILLVAAGLGAVGDRLDRYAMRLSKHKFRAVSAWALVGLVFVPLSVFDPADYYENRVADWKRAAAYLEGKVADGDIVVRFFKQQGRLCLDYYTRPDLSEQVFDVVAVANWYEARDPLEDNRPLPERLWFVCHEMQEPHRTLFEFEPFGKLHVVCRKRPIESWEDFWALLSDYLCLASKASNEAGRYVFYLLNQELIENGSLSFAYSLSKEIARRYPDTGEYQKELAEMALRMGDKDVAEQAYRAALDIIPGWSRFSRLAGILIEDRRYDEAEAVVLRAIAARNEPYQRTWLGMVYVASGKYDLAEQEFLKAIEMDPNYEYAHYELGQFYAMCNRRDEARAEFETVLRLKPGPRRVEAVQAQLEKLTAREPPAN